MRKVGILYGCDLYLDTDDDNTAMAAEEYLTAYCQPCIKTDEELRDEARHQLLN